MVEGIISDGDRICWFTTAAHDLDGTHEVVSPVFDNIEWNGVSCTVT